MSLFLFKYHAQWTALRWVLLVLLARETNPHWQHCTHSWSKTWKDPLFSATLWLGMAATRSGWQERTPPLPTLPSSSLISSDSLPPPLLVPLLPCLVSRSSLQTIVQFFIRFHLSYQLINLMIQLVPACLPISCPGPVSFVLYNPLSG